MLQRVQARWRQVLVVLEQPDDYARCHLRLLGEGSDSLWIEWLLGNEGVVQVGADQPVAGKGIGLGLQLIGVVVADIEEYQTAPVLYHVAGLMEDREPDLIIGAISKADLHEWTIGIEPPG